MLIESFLRYIRYEKNYSSHTVLSYKNDLFQFRDYVVRETGEFRPEQTDRDQVRNWVVSLVKEGDLPRSVGRKISALRSFFKFLVLQKVIPDTPIRNIQLPKIRKRLPSFVKQEEMDLLLDEVDFGTGFNAVRDRLMIGLLYSTGMRRSEMIGLQDTDVDLDSCSLKVTGKRDKQRIIPFGKELRDMIKVYVDIRNEEAGGATGSFLVRENGEPLYPQLVYRVVTRYLSSVCSLTKRSPHVLRHTFASAMLNNGAELNSVKELLGHSSLASTEVYTHITFEELKKSYKQAHPRADKKGGNYGN